MHLKKGIEKLENRYNWCITLERIYVERENIILPKKCVLVSLAKQFSAHQFKEPTSSNQRVRAIYQRNSQESTKYTRNIKRN